MLTTGTRLGPYEIVAPLGAGGMGEVYRARDARLGRDVAIKVLPEALAQDAARLRRFELEARATGALGHPNILAVFDIGTADGVPYVVSELLEGETLRSRIGRGALPARKALDLGVQAARGLAAAHDKGIVHRDLKPENVFVTADGHLKILDFGLAKLVPVAASGATATADLGAATDAGVVLGTAAYMSPEQVRGQAVDQRSDIFSFGVLLYEMVSGRRPFQGASTVETMNAILKDDPPEIADRATPQALDRIVRRCLEKEPAERFRSAYDLALALEAVSTSGTQAVPAVVTTRAPRRVIEMLAVGLALALAALAGRMLRPAAAPPPLYRQITFGRGTVFSARLTPDGNSAVYSAAWEGAPARLFTLRPENAISTPLDCPGAQVLAISASGEMAIKLGPGRFLRWATPGVLARVALGGGTPREVAADVVDADWSPINGDLAVVRNVQGRVRIEYPLGRVLHEAPLTTIQRIRFSPQGDRIGFGEGGEVGVIEGTTVRKLVPEGWWAGVAWAPSGREIWYGNVDAAGAHEIRAVSMDGKQRLVARVPGALVLWDIARDGRVLMSHDHLQNGSAGLGAGETRERDLSWLNTINEHLSADGRTVILWNRISSEIYLRGLDGSAPLHLGSGHPFELSPDGRSVVSSRDVKPVVPELVLLPTGVGDVRTVPAKGLRYRAARWMPDGAHLLVQASQGDAAPVRLYIQDVTSGEFRAVTPAGGATDGEFLPSPDGTTVAARDAERRMTLYPVAGGAAVPVAGLRLRERVIGWAADNRALFTHVLGELPATIERLDLATGRKAPWKQITPADITGMYELDPVRISPDGAAYVYSYRRNLGNLFLGESLR